ncbi:MAG: hypothetical protein J6W45_02265 [Bacteroidales bacterium]|nr:hypothetical protein [Bacteroidales bacterium]
MTSRKNIVKFWGIFCILLALALGAITLAHRWHRIFPSDEVSDIYLRYRDTDGLDVSYVKKYRVNDTVLVDVTLIETGDTVLWDCLCEDFHIPSISKLPEELRSKYLSDDTFGYRVEESSQRSEPRRDLIVYSRKNMSICVFHSLDNKQYDAIIDREIDKLSGSV